MSGSTAGLDGTSGASDRATSNDRAAEGLISFLASEGGARLKHGSDRTLLDHLVGTYQIVRRWNQPARLQHAALIHSVYGTEAYDRRLLALSRRADVSKLAGDQAERLAYLFCATPRDLLFAGTHVWARGLPSRAPGEREIDEAPPATRAELDCLVLLHMANLAEQLAGQGPRARRAADRQPGGDASAVRRRTGGVLGGGGVA
jgi:hypothetical protein